MNRPVLVLGVESRIAVTIARSLHRHDIPVDIGAISPEESAVPSRVIRQFWRLPRASVKPAELLPVLRAEIAARGYDMLVPCTDAALAACMRHYQELSALLHVACPPPEITGRVLNKLNVLETARRCGIKVPETFCFSTPAELEAAMGVLRFPLIAKPKEKPQADAFKMLRLDTPEELRGVLRENPQFAARNLIQEYCPGAGIGVEALMHKGRAVALFQHRRLKELPATGGVSVLAIADELDAGLAAQSVRLLQELHWEGVAMVEFRHDRETGTATLMEVNGRYWGSLPLAVFAGADFPYWHWQVVHAEAPDVSLPYRQGLCARWVTGDIIRLFGIFFGSANRPSFRARGWNELVRFVADFRPSTREMLWAWSDPAPALAELARVICHLVAASARRALCGVLPQGLQEGWRVSRQHGPAVGFVYLKRQLARAVGPMRDRSKRLPAKTRSIVFVCKGNIIRSPMAAALVRRLLGEGYPQTAISSAGLSARSENPADGRARIAAADFGISLEAHRAQPFTQELGERADAIVVMDLQDEAMLLSRFPHLGHKAFLLGALTVGAPNGGSRNGPVEIRDPYGGTLADVRACYRRLEGHIRELARLLSADD